MHQSDQSGTFLLYNVAAFCSKLDANLVTLLCTLLLFLSISLPHQQDVCGLEVPVDDLLVVQVLEAGDELPGPVAHVVLGQQAAVGGVGAAPAALRLQVAGQADGAQLHGQAHLGVEYASAEELQEQKCGSKYTKIKGKHTASYHSIHKA